MIYLHRTPVVFRKAVNRLSELLEQAFEILHWDKMSFVLWYKRLEKDKFKRPADDLENFIQVVEQSLS